ncbi:divalent-cation tolerance protein CutA [Consotaella salsifontis]|uniref:Divalent cation tolerance protein n=1 Tax=Consotaella salsifontis TaxID=1365950 RepID=A0A1T4QIP5_9HYPH|nr:divalent-cation tolerance protein CutA [Consotaella salsifontis]SKA03507.1 divalent cation tolerance protein [Consotaella salsifontis]
MTEAVEIEVTCPSAEEADRLSRRLVEARLVACAQVGAPLQSRYWWQGAVETAEEWPLVLKTRADLFEKVADEIRIHHPYETPAILGRAIAFIDPATRDWIEASAAPDA